MLQDSVPCRLHRLIRHVQTGHSRQSTWQSLYEPEGEGPHLLSAFGVVFLQLQVNAVGCVCNPNPLTKRAHFLKDRVSFCAWLAARFGGLMASLVAVPYVFLMAIAVVHPFSQWR